MINIGITTYVKDGENIWINGITQNVINFYKILKNSPEDYNIFILNTNNEQKTDNINGVKIHNIDGVINNIDLLFILGSQITDNHYNLLKKNGSKIVYYSCGSSYILDMENVLFGDTNTDRRIYKHIPDEIWSIPQNYEPNKHYFETIYRTNVKSVPFVWSPHFIDNIVVENNIKGYYTPSNRSKNIVSFEPNINIVKYAMYNIIIVEKTYRVRPELINHFYVTNATHIMKNELFVNMMNNFDIQKNGIVSFEGRFRAPTFLNDYSDIIVAHQMLNPLNYAYLDALYLNYPLIHNAHMIKDAGYYYDGFDAETGKEQLLFALEEHDNNIEEYNHKSNIVLNRYLPNNEESISIYDRMIKKLIKK